jgi:hypothetical protein
MKTDHKDNPSENQKPETRNLKPDPRPVVTLTNMFKDMSYDEATRALRGKATDPAQRAVLSIIRAVREDVVNASTSIRLSERESGFYAGAAHILREVEQSLVDAHTTPIDA